MNPYIIAAFAGAQFTLGMAKAEAQAKQYESAARNERLRIAATRINAQRTIDSVRRDVNSIVSSNIVKSAASGASARSGSVQAVNTESQARAAEFIIETAEDLAHQEEIAQANINDALAAARKTRQIGFLDALLDSGTTVAKFNG